MRFVFNGDLHYISLLGYFYVSDPTVYKLQQPSTTDDRLEVPNLDRYDGDLRCLSLLGYFYVSDSTVYKLQQRIICTLNFADVLTAATS